MSKRVKKYRGKKHTNEVVVNEVKSSRRWVIPLVVLVLVVATIIGCIFLVTSYLHDNVRLFNTKIDKLESCVLTDEVNEIVDENLAEDSGRAVFISVCNSMEKTQVFRSVGNTLDEAFNQAKQYVIDFLSLNKKFDPYWVKVDVVKICEETSSEGMSKVIEECSSGYNIAGLAFDEEFKSALLPQEIDAGELFDYESDEISIENLNILLGREKEDYIEELPDSFFTFSCLSWLCDDNSFVKELSSEYPSYGRRSMSATDKVAEGMSAWAVNYLQNFVGEDGKFIGSYYPVLGYEYPEYSNEDHAGAVWAMLEFYKHQESEDLKNKIDLAINYMVSTIVSDGDNSYAVTGDEVTADATSMYITTLVEYMRVFETEEYVDICKALGNGLLNLIDTEEFSYVKTLNSDLSENKVDTGFEDAKAILGLVKLASYTGDTKYAGPVDSALAYLINEQYTEKADPWLSYVLLDVVIYTKADENLCAFALANAQNNLESISDKYGTNPEDLELLLCAYKTYLVAKSNNVEVVGYSDFSLVQAIRIQIEKLFDGYFYPEYAMYMQNPRMVMGTFFERGNRFKVSLSSNYHSIMALLAYVDCYESLVSVGLDGDSLAVDYVTSTTDDDNPLGIDESQTIELTDENSYYDEEGRLIVKLEDGKEVVLYDPTANIESALEGETPSEDGSSSEGESSSEDGSSSEGGSSSLD